MNRYVRAHGDHRIVESARLEKTWKRGIGNIGVCYAGGTPSLILHWLYKGQIILVHSSVIRVFKASDFRVESDV